MRLGIGVDRDVDSEHTENGICRGELREDRFWFGVMTNEDQLPPLSAHLGDTQTPARRGRDHGI